MDLNNDVLGLVLMRVDSHVSLIRAAAVCKQWRHAIASAPFLRRFRSLHAPAVAGNYHNGSSRHFNIYVPTFVPSSPSLVDARHFSLDFLPDGAGSWAIQDCRGSILLMYRRDFLLAFPQVIVCEPLTRSFKVIPLPADFDAGYLFLICYLIDGYPCEAGGRISMSNFRVLCISNHDGVLHATMCTAGLSWSKKDIGHIEPGIEFPGILGRAGGSWYLFMEGINKLIELDGVTGDFTSSVLPAIEDLGICIGTNRCFVTEGRDGKPRIVTIFTNTMKVFARPDGGDWALEKSVLLDMDAIRDLPGYNPSFFSYGLDILTTGTGFVILSPQTGGPWPFSIDIETMEAELATGDMGPMLYPFELPWPPALHVALEP